MPLFYIASIFYLLEYSLGKLVAGFSTTLCRGLRPGHAARRCFHDQIVQNLQDGAAELDRRAAGAVQHTQRLDGARP